MKSAIKRNTLETRWFPNYGGEKFENIKEEKKGSRFSIKGV